MEACFVENKLFAWALSSSVAAVASDVTLTVCSEMAVKVLESNGTAVDTAVTAILCVWVPSVWSLQE